jgi:hypothetical protein
MRLLLSDFFRVFIILELLEEASLPAFFSFTYFSVFKCSIKGLDSAVSFISTTYVISIYSVPKLIKEKDLAVPGVKSSGNSLATQGLI